MVSRHYRRLLQRRLRRRPLLPFLLAATVAIDVAFIASSYDIVEIEARGNEPQGIFFIGTIVGQISLLGIWIASAWQGIVLRLGIAVLASQAIALVLAKPFHRGLELFSPLSATSIFLLLATTFVVGLSNLLINRLRNHDSYFAFSFSVKSLLLLTTVVAAIMMIVNHGKWIFLDGSYILVLLQINAVISVVLLVTCNRSKFWHAVAGILMALVFAPIASYWLAVESWGPAFQYEGLIAIISVWLLALRSRRLSPSLFQLRLLLAHEEAAPEHLERPLERRQVAELKEINVVV